MRSLVTVVGFLALLGAAGFAFLLGILAFTPTMSCTGNNTGSCAYGQLPQKLMLFGPPVIVVATGFATLWKAPQGGRAHWPWIGVALIFALFVTASGIAQG